MGAGSASAGRSPATGHPRSASRPDRALAQSTHSGCVPSSRSSPRGPSRPRSSSRGGRFGSSAAGRRQRPRRQAHRHRRPIGRLWAGLGLARSAGSAPRRSAVCRVPASRRRACRALGWLEVGGAPRRIGGIRDPARRARTPAAPSPRRPEAQATLSRAVARARSAASSSGASRSARSNASAASGQRSRRCRTVPWLASGSARSGTRREASAYASSAACRSPASAARWPRRRAALYWSKREPLTRGSLARQCHRRPPPEVLRGTSASCTAAPCGRA
jgi:hypothetical protein